MDPSVYQAKRGFIALTTEIRITRLETETEVTAMEAEAEEMGVGMEVTETEEGEEETEEVEAEMEEAVAGVEMEGPRPRLRLAADIRAAEEEEVIPSQARLRKLQLIQILETTTDQTGGRLTVRSTPAPFLPGTVEEIQP
jgi:hypothetical protein